MNRKTVPSPLLLPWLVILFVIVRLGVGRLVQEVRLVTLELLLTVLTLARFPISRAVLGTRCNRRILTAVVTGNYDVVLRVTTGSNPPVEIRFPHLTPLRVD